jgi:HAD superfamily hydrolase (TIGR01509 family)
MPGYELIIFDCDGVLVDSERIANTAFAEVLNELGLSLTLEDMFDIFVGHSSSQCMQIVEEMLGRKPPPELETQYKQRINSALKQQVQAVRGVEDVIKSLTIPYCVASSGNHEKMRTTLTATNLFPYFEHKLYSVTEVQRGKPYPDVYLYAAQQMGVAPAKCVVVEDTPIGVQGGRAAGMTVFGYAELMKADRLIEAGAHRTFDRMEMLPQFISIKES